MKRPSANRRRAFTLMELLIAIALIMALFGAMFGFLYDMLATRSRVLELTAQQRAASLLIDRIERDLLACITGHPAHGAGVQGDESSLRLLTRGVLAGHADDDAGDKSFGDLQSVHYRFDPQSHELTARHGSAGSDAAEPASFDARLFKVRFRYHDGGQWVTSFDSREAERLPLAVEVAVWFDPWPGDDWGEPDDATAAERMTFDLEGVFDEAEYAMRGDRDFRDDPIPDRVRIILVPDAAEADDA